MKISFLLVALLVSSFSYGMTEVECDGVSGSRRIRIELDGFGGSPWKQARVEIQENGQVKVHNYNVSTRPSSGMGQVLYTAPAFNLRVDFWPDRAPRWGRSYRADFLSPLLSNVSAFLYCRYPFAQ